MASPTLPVSARAADAAVGRLVVEIQAGVDELVDGIVARIRAELPDFRRLPASTLARAVRGNVTRALAALAELRPPTAGPSSRAQPRWAASAPNRA